MCQSFLNWFLKQRIVSIVFHVRNKIDGILDARMDEEKEKRRECGTIAKESTNLGNVWKNILVSTTNDREKFYCERIVHF